MKLTNPVFIKPSAETCTVRLIRTGYKKYYMENNAVGIHLVKMIIVEKGNSYVEYAYGFSSGVVEDCFVLNFLFIGGGNHYWFFNSKTEAENEYKRIIEGNYD